MTKRRLKKGTIYALYISGLCVLFGIFYLIDGFTYVNYNNDDFVYVDSTIVDNAIPVVNESDIIIRPYTDTNVLLSKDYYDISASEDEQKNSIIYYENTYMPNTSILYTNTNQFAIVSVLDGEVTNIIDDPILGKVIQIKHSKDIMSIYQSVDEVSVNIGDKVVSGQVIATSGSCKLTTDTENNLYFEMIVNGQNVDPENFYNKSISEI